VTIDQRLRTSHNTSFSVSLSLSSELVTREEIFNEIELAEERWTDPDVLVKPDIKRCVQNRCLWDPELRLEIKRHDSVAVIH
jgi:hypothetical protein